MKADLDQLILTQYPTVIAYCLPAPNGSPAIPSESVTELNEKVHIIITAIIQYYLIGGKDSGGIKTGYLTAG